MPSKSKKQARFMAAAAHNPKFAKKVGIKQSVAKDFNHADARTGILRKASGGLAMAYAPTMRGRRIPSPQGQKRSIQPVMDSVDVYGTGDQLRGIVNRLSNRRVMRRAEGGKIGGLSALRLLAKKFQEALEAGDTALAKRIQRQMELLDQGSSRQLAPGRGELDVGEEKAATFAEGGKVKAAKSLKEILARDFRKAAKLKDTDPVSVQFHKDESTTIHAKGKKYRFQAGSDDDRFDFHSEDGEHIPVEFSDDWLNHLEGDDE